MCSPRACFNEACGYDAIDCADEIAGAAAVGLSPAQLKVCVETTECKRPWLYDGVCSPSACFNEACGYDAIDCAAGGAYGNHAAGGAYGDAAPPPPFH